MKTQYFINLRQLPHCGSRRVLTVTGMDFLKEFSDSVANFRSTETGTLLLPQFRPPAGALKCLAAS